MKFKRKSQTANLVIKSDKIKLKKKFKIKKKKKEIKLTD